MLPEFRKSFVFLGFARLSFWYQQHADEGRSTDGMILTGQIRRTRRETRPIATSITHLTRHGMGSNPDLRDDRPANNPLSHATA